MERIKIKNLPRSMEIEKTEMEKILGGAVVSKYIGETEKNLLETDEFDIQSSLRLSRPTVGGEGSEEHFFVSKK